MSVIKVKVITTLLYYYYYYYNYYYNIKDKKERVYGIMKRLSHYSATASRSWRLQKIPRRGSVVKYLCPFTLPSQLPTIMCVSKCEGGRENQ